MFKVVVCYNSICQNATEEQIVKYLTQCSIQIYNCLEISVIHYKTNIKYYIICTLEASTHATHGSFQTAHPLMMFFPRPVNTRTHKSSRERRMASYLSVANISAVWRGVTATQLHSYDCAKFHDCDTFPLWRAHEACFRDFWSTMASKVPSAKL